MGPSGRAAQLRWQASSRKALACDLLIATVADHLLGEEVRQLAYGPISAGDLLKAMTDQTLRVAEARARELGVIGIEVRTAWGDVAQSLLDIASGSSAKVIVVGRRGRGQLAGLLLGSVSQKLVSLAPCPVVVVP